eukprot:4123128-Heterocapsa_arctica.AAC.1
MPFVSDLHKLEISKIRGFVECSAIPPKTVNSSILFSTQETVSITIMFSLVRSSGCPDSVSKN